MRLDSVLCLGLTPEMLLPRCQAVVTGRGPAGGNWDEDEDDIASSTERSQRKVAVPVASTLGLPVFRKFAC